MHINLGTITTAIGIIGIILFVIGVVWIVFSGNRHIGPKVAMIVISIICLLICVGLCIYIDIETREQAKVNIENGYEVYLNGVKVNPDTININSYNITIKDDDKIIILSNK